MKKFMKNVLIIKIKKLHIYKYNNIKYNVNIYITKYELNISLYNYQKKYLNK